jgi:hypothetical protein
MQLPGAPPQPEQQVPFVQLGRSPGQTRPQEPQLEVSVAGWTHVGPPVTPGQQ